MNGGQPIPMTQEHLGNPWRGVLPSAYAVLALVALFALIVDDRLFDAAWRRGLPAALAALPAALAACSALMVLWHPTRRLGAGLGALLGAAACLLLFPQLAGFWGPAGAGLLLGGAALVRWNTPIGADTAALWARLRERRTWRRLVLAAVLLGAALPLWQLLRPLPESPGASRAARRYLADAITLIRRQSLRRDTVDWPAVTDSAFRLAAGAQATHDVHRAVRYVVRALGDHHSVFLDSAGQARLATGPAPAPILRARTLTLPEGRMFGPGVGVLVVPWFADAVNDRRRWVARLRLLLDSLAAEGARGWIVDLRFNLGGNMWPMLEGLGPLFGDGPVGGIEMPQWGRRQRWWMLNGWPYGGVPILAGLPVPGRHPNRSPRTGDPVAVLLGPRTVSSGEAVAIAFRGRPDTRFFGAATDGLSTANAPIPLRDGAVAVVTIGVDLDRTGHRYGGPVEPDEVVPGDGEGPDEPALLRAAEWIRSLSREPARSPSPGTSSLP